MNIVIVLRNGKVSSVISDEYLSTYVADWGVDRSSPIYSQALLEKIDSNTLESAIEAMFKKKKRYKNGCHQLDIYEVIDIIEEEENG